MSAPKGSASLLSARGGGERSQHARRVLRYGDQPLRVITHKVMRGSSGFYSPVNFTVTDHANGASTKVEGVRSDADVTYTDADFSEAALQTITSAPGKSG